MRHAKSDWYAGVASDFDRPLNERGRKSSDCVGAYFQREQVVPDKILHSSALRTTQTANRVFEGAGWKQNSQQLIVEASPNLYLCSEQQLIGEISKTQPDVNVLFVVNHQPTCSETVQQLCKKWVDFKTASFVIMEFEMEDWGLVEVAPNILVEGAPHNITSILNT